MGNKQGEPYDGPSSLPWVTSHSKRICESLVDSLELIRQRWKSKETKAVRVQGLYEFIPGRREPRKELQRPPSILSKVYPTSKVVGKSHPKVWNSAGQLTEPIYSVPAPTSQTENHTSWGSALRTREGLAQLGEMGPAGAWTLLMTLPSKS